MNILSAFGMGVAFGGFLEIAYGLLAPRWNPGDYTRLVDAGFISCVVGAIFMITGFIFLGV